MDEKLYLSTNRSPSESPPDFSQILRALLVSCPELKHKDPSDFDDIPDAVRLIMGCWGSSFKSARELEVFWPESFKLSFGSSFPRNSTRLTRAFLRDRVSLEKHYEGNCHEMCLESLKDMTRGRTHADYSNIASVIQGSGTGKSRLFDEMATNVFTIPFNLNNTGYGETPAGPPVDNDVLAYLARESSDHTGLRLAYLAFFQSLFTNVRKQLQTLRAQARSDLPCLAKQWKDYLSSNSDRGLLSRDQLYQQVVTEAAQILGHNWGRQWAKLELTGNAIQELHYLLMIINPGSPHPWRDPPATPYLPADLQIVITFDELFNIEPKPSFLEPRPPTDELRPNVKALLSVIEKFNKYPVVAVVLSTTPCPVRLSPRRNEAEFASQKKPHTPAVETPWDCSPYLDVKSGQLTFSAVSDPHFMANFGRPFWWTLWSTPKFCLFNLRCHEDLAVVPLDRDPFRVVRGKLVTVNCCGHLNAGQMCCLAVTDVRLCLEYDLRDMGNRDLVARLVKDHMRIMYTVPQHGEAFQSGYPSEPVLAEAAAQQIHSWERSDTTNILLQTLQESTTRGYLDLGKLVGAVARALLTMAYDRASQRRTAWKEDQRRFFSGGCHLIDFISELFRPNDAFKIFVSRPDNVHDVCPFGKAFHHARLRFTHFVKLDMKRGASTAELWPAFVRGMAFLNVRSGLGVVDLYIPMLLWDTEIREDVMTAVLIKVKHQCETGSSQSDITAETAGLFASPLVRPYCTIVMELGTDPEVEGITVKTMASQLEEPLRPQRNQRGVHPRYNFCVRGCSDKAFKVLDEEGSGICASLLAACDGSTEHPLEMEPSPRAVGRMIPVWTDEKSCYDWVKNYSSGRDAQEPRPEGEEELSTASSLHLHGKRCLEESEPVAKKQARTSNNTPQDAAGVQKQEIGKDNQKRKTDETG